MPFVNYANQEKPTTQQFTSKLPLHQGSSQGQMKNDAHKQSQAAGFTCCGFWHACLCALPHY